MKKAITTLIVLLLLTSLSFAQTIKKQLLLHATTPSPFGNYDQLRTVPRAPIGNCEVGTFYVPTTTNRIMYCAATNTWVPLSPLEQTGDDITLTDTSSPENKRLAIGTGTPELMLTLDSDGGIIAKGGLTVGYPGRSLTTSGAGVRFIWYPVKAAIRAGEVSSTQWDDANIGQYSTAFGRDTRASGVNSVVSGGASNSALGLNATVSGGQNNTAQSRAASILGGESNNIYFDGDNNTGGIGSSIVGGGNHRIWSNLSTIAGGSGNKIGENNLFAGESFIGGGKDNEINSTYSAILGGLNNKVGGLYATVTGGHYNRVDGVASMVSGHNLWIRDLGTDPDRGALVFAFGYGGGDINNPLQITKNNSAVFVGVNVGMGTVAPTHPLHIDSVMKLEPQASPPMGCSTPADVGALYVDNDPTTMLCICVSGNTWQPVGDTGTCS